jgi:hypothetical protein
MPNPVDDLPATSGPIYLASEPSTGTCRRKFRRRGLYYVYAVCLTLGLVAFWVHCCNTTAIDYPPIAEDPRLEVSSPFQLSGIVRLTPGLNSSVTKLQRTQNTVLSGRQSMHRLQSHTAPSRLSSCRYPQIYFSSSPGARFPGSSRLLACRISQLQKTL